MVKVYVAGPLFTEGERGFLEKVDEVCKGLGLETYLPHRDTNPEMGVQKIYESHLRALKECSLLVAVLEGPDVDSGTAFELGYFRALGKPVIGLRTDFRVLYLPKHGEIPEVNLMVRFSLDRYVKSLGELTEALKQLKGL
ncbi:TPA: nucleoside 2-deoxyribosyltransferase [Candidatus Bathyarchaeota archaeon]|nr:nucleoside 2-deoxyribosyltransferase [Candidatus Bathyarchaeota archaeon]